jgi:secreted trypsin-like serine protease
VTHPSYDSSTNENDVALLFLEESASLDITLPQLNNNGEFPLPGSTTHVMGWGVTDDGGCADVLMRVDLAVISNEDCDNAELGENNYNGKIFDNMICTETDGQDTCEGDSGEAIAGFSWKMIE